MIRVGVLGAGGRMGVTVCQAVVDDPGMELVAAVDPQQVGIDLRQLGVNGASLNVTRHADALLDAGAEVAVDFTVLEAARSNLEWCADKGVHAVVGTSGFEHDEIDALAKRFDASSANAVIAPNFAIGAVLMMRFAEMAAPYFDSAEIIELHHDGKVDAPSGTAISTAERMAAASSEWSADPTTKVTLEGARGARGAGIPIHSVRLRGLVAHQEVLLGKDGQSLTIRHDSYDRTSCFMPGVLLAVRGVRERPGLTFGLDELLGL
ncbi:MAG: 4-hydroxy-tetrahydrodipicolinate reductase [Acidimicrobiia bacterium]